MRIWHEITSTLRFPLPALLPASAGPCSTWGWPGTIGELEGESAGTGPLESGWTQGAPSCQTCFIHFHRKGENNSARVKIHSHVPDHLSPWQTTTEVILKILSKKICIIWKSNAWNFLSIFILLKMFPWAIEIMSKKQIKTSLFPNFPLLFPKPKMNLHL